MTEHLHEHGVFENPDGRLDQISGVTIFKIPNQFKSILHIICFLHVMGHAI